MGSEKPDFNHIYDSAFGFNSPYSYLLNQNYSWLNIACSLYETCSFMHHVEYLNSDKIVYRSKLKFPVSISLDRDDQIVKKIDYEYFGKTSEFQEYRDNWSPLDVLQNSLCHQFNTSSGLYPLEYLLERGTQLLNQNSMIFCKPY